MYRNYIKQLTINQFWDDTFSDRQELSKISRRIIYLSDFLSLNQRKIFRTSMLLTNRNFNFTFEKSAMTVINVNGFKFI